MWSSILLTVQLTGRCRAMMKMWKLSHTDVCDCVDRQTVSHRVTSLSQSLLVSAVPNTERSLYLTKAIENSTNK